MYTTHVGENPVEFLAKPGRRPGTCPTRRCWPPRILRAQDLLGSGKQTRTLQVPSRKLLKLRYQKKNTKWPIEL